MKKIIIFLVLLSTNIFAESGFTLKISSESVDSAAVKNAIQTKNARLTNELIKGSFFNELPMDAGKMKGTGINLDFNFGSGFLTNHIILGYAGLKNDSISSLQLVSSATAINFFSINMAINTQGNYLVSYNNNKLDLGNLGYLADLHIFKGRNEKYLEGLRLRLGFVIRADAAKINAPYTMGSTSGVIRMTSSATTGGSPTTTVTPIATSGLNIPDMYAITNSEYYAEIPLGFLYTLPIMDRHSLDLGLEYRYGKGLGKYENKNTASVSIFPGMPAMPGTIKFKGDNELEISGTNMSIAYNYQANEKFSFGIGYSSSSVTHKIAKSKVKNKDAVGFMDLLSGNMPKIIADSMAPLGPNPSNVDKRQSIFLSMNMKF
ncbi:MAG: hypothetical protein H7A25_19150 [Leptospiraceae bacterium]|nr:hypothetical protein [Leptospiraceae bacterium]